jgi:hypothetical protein
MEYVANTQGFFTLNATEVCHKTFGSLSKLKKKNQWRRQEEEVLKVAKIKHYFCIYTAKQSNQRSKATAGQDTTETTELLSKNDNFQAVCAVAQGFTKFTGTTAWYHRFTKRQVL